MDAHRRKLDWCLEKEARMRRIKPDKRLAAEHIEKAKHNLKAMQYNIKGGFDDWAVSQAYYAMYHALLAILFSKGFESKNHECTINAVEHLIKRKEVLLEKEDIAAIRTTEQMTKKDAKSLREEFQYGTKTSANKILLEGMMADAKAIVEKTEMVLQDR